MFTDLIEALKALFGAATALGKLESERRAKLADYLDSIATVLKSIVQRNAQRENAVDLCAELTVYAERIRDVAKGTVSAEDIDKLSKALIEAHHSRSMMHLNSGGHDRQFTDQLSEAAGYLHGLAITLRAK